MVSKAADQGYAAAQNKLGHMYEYGRGVPRNYAEALKWFRKAADQDFPEAQYNLGVMYCGFVNGAPKDLVEAYKWISLDVLRHRTSSGSPSSLKVEVGILRDIEHRMTSQQIAEAQKLVREWKPTK